MSSSLSRVGYAWRVACCAECGSHLGWRFRAQPEALDPAHFYGWCGEETEGLSCSFVCVYVWHVSHTSFLGLSMSGLTLDAVNGEMVDELIGKAKAAEAE